MQGVDALSASMLPSATTTAGEQRSTFDTGRFSLEAGWGRGGGHTSACGSDLADLTLNTRRCAALPTRTAKKG